MANSAPAFTINRLSVKYAFHTLTILLLNLYIAPHNATQTTPIGNMTEVQAQQFFDEFFEEVFVECEEKVGSKRCDIVNLFKYGEIEEMNVCDNLGDHLVGNVYIKFRREADAEKAVTMLNSRWFGGRPVHAELSPVSDFREACCRQYELGECTRGGFCNFMHLKPISRELCRTLFNRGKRRFGGGRRPSKPAVKSRRKSKSPGKRSSRR
ncbi:unnamed protein product [Dibothriocephalus latus]|uniref:C3H1-type domain-containing protein n=1 Tax=Dibothriocephalus latus TaxID=60516 RepID=A0A3P7LD39_DIBLA|nr:unnamed protein product [Dibothriocephalus latus]